jgi:hypothetical protein
LAAEAPELLHELGPKDSELLTSWLSARDGHDAIELVEERADHRGLVPETRQHLGELDLAESDERSRHGGLAHGPDSVHLSKTRAT